MAPEFFQTIMGKVFYEGTMPKIARELERLNNNLDRLATLGEEIVKAIREKKGG